MRCHFLLCAAVTYGQITAAQHAEPKVPPIWPGPSFDPRTSPGQYVYLTPERNALIIYDPARVKQEGYGVVAWLLPLLNEAKPRLSVEIRRNQRGIFEYEYTLENAADARTPIGRFSLGLEPGDPHFNMRHDYAAGQGWGGDKLPPMEEFRVAVQTALPGAPKAVYRGWFHYAFTNLIYPGQKMTGFVLEGSYRPGFTTAYIGPGRGWDFDMSWPGEVLEQLSFLRLPEWREQYVLTIAARYGPNAERGVIAREFLTGITQWISAGRLERDSPFVAAARAVVNEWAARSSGAVAIPGGARTQAERELEAALRFTLGGSDQ